MIEESNDINEFEQALRESFEAEELKPGDVINIGIADDQLEFRSAA